MTVPNASAPDTPRLNERLAALLDVAQAATGTSRAALARLLNRDPAKLSIPSGAPKIDLVISLGELLGWPIDRLAEVLVPEAEDREPTPAGATFASLDSAAFESYRAGDYAAMLRTARWMHGLARTGEERARACRREFGGWEGQGRYLEALDAARRGLRAPGVSEFCQLSLTVNLANAHYLLGNHVEAQGLATEVVERLGDGPHRQRGMRTARAFAHYVRGQSRRAALGESRSPDRKGYEKSRADLAMAEEEFLGVSRDFEDPQPLGMANYCTGALIEVDAELGAVGAPEAVRRIIDGLDRVPSLREGPVGDMYESYGWWCVYGAGIAVRRLDEEERSLPLGIMLNKLYDIADDLKNWSLCRLAFEIDFVRRSADGARGESPLRWTLEDDEVRLVVALMGRFPRFFRTGWRILEAHGPGASPPTAGRRPPPGGSARAS